MRRSVKGNQSGFALAALIFFLTAASIAIAAIVPSYQMQAKRLQEEELIFRGEEYMRAIQKFQRKYTVYPPSIEALVETNGMRFIRKPYTDPMTGKPFRLITINPDGSVSGSTLLNRNNNQNPLGQSIPQSQQNLGLAQMQQAQQFSQQLGRGQQTQQQQQPGRSGSQTPQGLQGQQGQQGQQRPGQQQPGQPLQGQQRPGQTGAPGLSGPTAPQGSSGIIGVASESQAESVMVYNSRQHYNEWEFIAILQAAQPGQQGQQGGPGQPTVPGFGQPAMPQPGIGQPRPSQPFGFGQPQPQQPNQPVRRPD